MSDGPAPGRWQRLLPLVAWFVVLAVAIVAFTAAGDGRLAAPPLTDPGTWGAWADSREPVEAVMAVLRLVVLGLAWYLLGVLTIGVVARLARSARMIRVADALSVPFVRRGLEQALGITLATVVMAGAAAGTAAEMRGDHEVATSTTLALSDDEGMVLSMESADGADPMVLQRMDDGMVLERVDTSPREHLVVSGEHLWSISAQHLDELGLPCDDAAIAAHLADVIEVNRDRLVDRDNPDLILPGQVFLLPTPGSTPS